MKEREAGAVTLYTERKAQRYEDINGLGRRDIGRARSAGDQHAFTSVKFLRFLWFSSDIKPILQIESDINVKYLPSDECYINCS